MPDAIQTAFSQKEHNSETMISFGYRLRNQFFQNKAYRRAKELQWLEDLRSFKGIYDPDVKIEPGNSKVYPKVPRSKVNIALSRLHEMLFPSNDKNWELSPTPEPKISKDIVTQIALAMVRPPEVDPQTNQPIIDPQTGQPSQPILPTADELQLAIKKFAKETAAKMSSVIDDQFTEMDYPEETKKVLRSGLQYGTGLMKGPMVGKRTKRRWQPVGLGDYEEQVETEDVPDLQFVRVWDWYPDMTGTDIEKIEGSFERHIMVKHDLRLLMKRPDFYPEMISKFLEDNPNGNYTPENWEVDLQVIESEIGGKSGEYTISTGLNDDRNRSTNRQTGKKYEVLEYWGYVDGSDLEACGLNVDDPSLEYAANVWLLGDKPIKALLYPAALDHYKVFYYEKDETSIFGEGLVRVMRHSALSIAAASRMVLDNGACVAGNTEVYRNRSTAYGTDLPDSRPAVITIKELWDTKYKHNSGLRRMKIRSINEDTGEIFYNRIVDVFNNGVRPVFEMKTLKGYHVKSTDDHRFMRDDGDWQEARDFCIRDMIAVNGKHNRPSGICINCGKTTKGTGIRCRSCAMIKTHPPDIDLPKKCIECGAKTATRGVRCKKCAAKLENNSWNRRQAEEASLNMDASANTSRQRWACQKDKKDVCERCGAKSDAGIRLDVHHKDRNPYNNDPSNKLTLCCPCHMWIQSRHDYFGQPFQHKYVDYDEIVSIEYVGEEEVFDIQVETPNHNFIANGFVAHNCVAGPQVEVNWSLMTPGTDLNSFYSRKIWFREGKGVDAQYPALRVYNIDSHIGELIKIIELFKSFGDEETTLPTWMIGQQVNNETAQATSGRNSTVLVSIKDIVKNFDAFTEHIIRDMYAWNMEFNPRQDIKGDYLCKARGVSSLVMKEIRMQALVQLNSTLTPEQRDYIPEGEMVNEIFKAHDINITLLSDEEVQKKREAREQSIQNQLALKMAEAEISYKKAQTMSQLTKAKKTNTDATIAANTPIEQPAGSDPRLADAELQGKQTETVGKEAEIRRQDEQHALDLQHQDEQHRVKIATEAAKTSQDMEIKGKTADHSMAMSEKMTQAKAKQAGKAPKPKKPAKGV